jgi:hypothetical protein
MTQEERVLDIRANYIASVFGNGLRAGFSYAVTCPKCCDDEHRRKKKKLSIRLDNGMHHCWICGLKGKTLLYTIKKFFPTRLHEYTRIFNEEDYQCHIECVEEQEEILELPSGFIPLVTAYKSCDPDIRDVIDYLCSRGLGLDDFWRWRLGTCTSGRFSRRVIMPSFDQFGTLNYFTARSIDSDGAKKYINSKVKRKDVVFNEINIRWDEPIILVEGPFDLTKCGWNSIAMLGSFLDESYVLFRKIVTHGSDVVLVLDQDASQKMIKIAHRLSSYGINVKCVNLDKFNDVGEMSKLEFRQILVTAYEWSPTSRLQSLISQIKSGSIL